MGDSGTAGELPYDPLQYRDLWPGVEELLPPLSRHDALLDAPHLLLDAPFAAAGDLEVVERDGTLDLTFAPPVEPEDARDARALYGSVGSEGDRMVLRFRLLDDAGQPVSSSACKLCDGPVDLFRAHEHSVQGRLVLSGDCVVLEVGAVPQHVAHTPPLNVVPEALAEGFPSQPTAPPEPEPPPPETGAPVWLQVKPETPKVEMPQPMKSECQSLVATDSGPVACLDPDDPVPVVTDPPPAPHTRLPAAEDPLPYRCAMCPKAFSTRRVLNKHALIHSGVRHSCDQCLKTFARLDRLRRHQLTHAGQRQFACELCSKTFARREYLTQHQRVHTGEQPYQCDICGLRFGLLSNFTMHKRVHNAEKRFACGVCSRGFNRLDHLEAHRLQHSGEKPLICEKCGLQFTARERLRRHMVVHAQEKMFGCAVCKRRFHRKDKLAQHMASHAADGGGHACDLCPRVLARLDLLRQHARQHADPANVQCPTCFKFFIGQVRYEAHVQRHHKASSNTAGAGGGQHACLVCLKSFRRPAALQAHLKKAHGQASAGAARAGGSVQCHLCERTFTRQQTLRAHLRRVHGSAAGEPTAAAATAAPEPDVTVELLPPSEDASLEEASDLAHSAYQMLSFPSYSF